MRKDKRLEHCEALLDNELQPIPIRGSAEKNPKKKKAPAVNTWHPLKNEILSLDELRTLLAGGLVESRTDLAKDGNVSKLQTTSSNWDWYGIVCGSPSGNLEVIDIDVKNDPTHKVKDDFYELIKNNRPGLFEKLTIAKTISDGVHIYYRTPSTQYGHEVPAQNPSGGEIIAFRGQDHYVVAPPSTGYEFTQGGIDSIPYITDEDREFLFSIAESLTQFKTTRTKHDPDFTEKKKTTKDDWELTSIDDYDQRGNALEVLYELGWQEVGTENTDDGLKVFLLRPPGNNPSTSENSGNWHEGFRTLSIFSGSVEPFKHYLEDQKAILEAKKTRNPDTDFKVRRAMSPSAVYCYFKCGGDWFKTAYELGGLGYGIPKKPTQEGDDTTEDYWNEKVYTIASTPTSETYYRNLIANLPPGLKSGYYIGKDPLTFAGSGLSYIVGGSGHGKTTMLTNIAYNVAEDNLDSRVFYISLEQPRWRLNLYALQRHLANPGLLKSGQRFEDAIFDYWKNGSLEKIQSSQRTMFTQGVADFHETLIESGRLQIVDSVLTEAKKTLSDVGVLCKLLERISERDPVKLVCIDYVQRLHPPINSPYIHKSKPEQLDYVCDQLIKTANSSGLTLVLASQLNRTGREHHLSLTMENISDASAIEKSAEGVYGIYNNDREPTILKTEPEKPTAKYIIEKQLCVPKTMHVKVLKDRQVIPDTWDNIPSDLGCRHIKRNQPPATTSTASQKRQEPTH
jgi:hypothetical protein